MRIAQVVPFFHPHIGGVESFVGNLVKGLAARGHEVTVITSRHDSDVPVNDELFGASVERFEPIANILHTPVAPLLARAVSAGKYDIVHAHTPPPITDFYAARGARAGGMPLVLSYHGDPEPAVRFGNLISMAYQRTFGAFALGYAKRIIVHTRTYAATSRALWKYEPVIIPSAVDITRFSPKNNPLSVREKHGIGGRKIALFVGRLVPTKGIEYFIRSAEFTDKNTVHMIVGAGDIEPSLRALVKKLGLGDRIIFAGRADDAELPEYYAACDVFVLPSVSRLEGFGLVTLEAMSTGKPVLVSDIPGVREVIEPGREGLLIEPMNPKDIGGKICTVLSDDGLRRIFGVNARSSAETKYSWDKVISRIEQVYSEVAGG